MIEVQYGKSSLDPNPVDSDSDLLTDFEERVFTGTDSHKEDTDGDGLPDGLDGPHGDPYFEGITNIEKYRKCLNRYKIRDLFYEVPSPLEQLTYTHEYETIFADF